MKIMMKTALVTTATVLAFAAPSWAASELDTDSNGTLSLEEVQAVYPDITAVDFAAMDANSDGALDDEEINAAQEAGLLQ